MEGLLPLVYRAIKKNKTRRQYECLSSGDAPSYNISMAEFNHQTQTQTHDEADEGHIDLYQTRTSPPTHHSVADLQHAQKIGHRRHKTVGDFANGFRSPHSQRTDAAGSSASKQLARFSSHRMFSCISGV